jgi:hypothetical protein
MDDSAEYAKDEKGRFVTGNIGGGRPKGSRNKLGEKFLEDLLDDWSDHGKDVLVAMREKDPSGYVRAVASTLPKELNVKVSELDELSDDELSRRYDALTKALVAAGFGDRPGIAAAQEPQSAQGLQTLQ